MIRHERQLDAHLALMQALDVGLEIPRILYAGYGRLRGSGAGLIVQLSQRGSTGERRHNLRIQQRPCGLTRSGLVARSGDHSPGDARRRAHSAARYHRVGPQVWGRPGARRRSRALQLPRARRTDEPIFALGSERGGDERADYRAHDGQSARVFRDLAGAHPSGCDRCVDRPDLRAPAVAHALTVARAQRVIAAAECADVCAEAIAGLDDTIEIWVHGEGRSEKRRIDLAVSNQSGGALVEDERRPVSLADRALRIFSSGTTGMPKAAEVSHRRLVVWSHWFAGLAGLTASDRLYNCLPMHHSVGGVVAVAAPLVFGGSVAIAERFSARGFWDDVARWECTCIQYIGELCRFLVAAPMHPKEKDHKIRIALGNGLSEDVWRAFIDRFGPLRILEFYASTEGNVWL